MVLRFIQPRPTVSLSLLCRQVTFLPRCTLFTRSPGPILTRRSDRALPPVPSSLIWLKTLPIFIAIITASALGIFNYEKASSSVVSSTLYALRNSEAGRRELGDEIYFRDKFPWIWGEMNQLHGRIDICFGVKGTKSKGMMRFRSFRKRRMGYFQTQEWSLETEDGRVIQLLEDERADPFQNTLLQAQAKLQEANS